MNESERHPLDYDALRKGDIIEQEKIEEIFNVKLEHDPDMFRLHQMKLVELIERNRTDVYPRIERHSIRLMHDREAEEYNGARHRSHVRGLARDARRRGRIDRSGFNDVERRAAESRDLGYSAMALMATRALTQAEREAKLLGAGEKDAEDVEV